MFITGLQVEVCKKYPRVFIHRGLGSDSKFNMLRAAVVLYAPLQSSTSVYTYIAYVNDHVSGVYLSLVTRSIA